jgi:putative restriction endonuclease
LGADCTVKAFVAVTDGEWYAFLRDRPDLEEVNFWQPGGGQEFKALSVGEPFLFKLRYPENAIVGGGFFSHFSLLPVSLAWQAFGEKNGAASFPAMRERIERLRRSGVNPHEDYTIGCVILSDPFFFERGDWIPAPADFHPNIVRGKGYDLASESGRKLWDELVARRAGRRGIVAEPSGPMYGDPVEVRPRLGQGGFRVMVTDVYERRCAVTGEKALPVLEAAHIRPVSQGGVHDVRNGILLRSDVHTLFDVGFVTITNRYRFHVSSRLKEDFDNGEHYYKLDDALVWTPASKEIQPARELLEWHGDVVFRG